MIKNIECLSDKDLAMVRQHINDGKIVKAIKACRACTGLSLKDAKGIVDHLRGEG